MSTHPPVQQAITLSKTLVKHVKFECDSLNANCTEDLQFLLNTGVSFNESNNKIFIVEFLADFKNKTDKEKFVLKVSFVALFQTNEPINDEFKTSAFTNVNAPAIAFPFLRSFVTTFVSNAGFNPIIISSINFAAMFSGAKKSIEKQ
jgi:preprotein translocase subunit SecB